MCLVLCDCQCSEPTSPCNHVLSYPSSEQLEGKRSAGGVSPGLPAEHRDTSREGGLSAGMLAKELATATSAQKPAADVYGLGTLPTKLEPKIPPHAALASGEAVTGIFKPEMQVRNAAA